MALCTEPDHEALRQLRQSTFKIHVFDQGNLNFIWLAPDHIEFSKISDREGVSLEETEDICVKINVAFLTSIKQGTTEANHLDNR